MFDASYRDLRSGDEFTFDDGRTWWCLVRSEPREHGDMWYEALRAGERMSGVISETVHGSDRVVIR